jgi:hypothetical protein
MTACEYSAMITGIACTISKDKSKEELALIASMFYQLGRSVETIAIYGVCCQAKADAANEQSSTDQQAASNSCTNTDKSTQDTSEKTTKTTKSTNTTNNANSRNKEDISYYDRIGIEPRILSDFSDMFDL